jgi:hypothetical protein
MLIASFHFQFFNCLPSIALQALYLLLLLNFFSLLFRAIIAKLLTSIYVRPTNFSHDSTLKKSDFSFRECDDECETIIVAS